MKTLLGMVLALFAAAAFAAVDANKATQAELESIKGIGPAISAKILDERKKSAFKDWNDMIERVKGVGEGNAAKFSAGGLTVNGSTFGGAASMAAKKDDKPAAKKQDKAPAAAAANGAKADKAAPSPTVTKTADDKPAKTTNTKAEKAQAAGDAASKPAKVKAEAAADAASKSPAKKQ